MRKWRKYKDRIENCDVVIYYDAIEYGRDGNKKLYKGKEIVAELGKTEVLVEVSEE